MDKLEKTLKALADKNRLYILGFLYQKKLCVCELADLLKITQPSVSKHLKKLKDAGIIISEQDGFWTNYGFNNKFLKKHKVIKLLIENSLQLPEIKRKSKKLNTLNRENLCKK